jgi:hypothetical protein
MAHFAQLEDGIVVSTIETEYDIMEAGLVGNPSWFIEYAVDGSSRPAVFGGTYDFEKKEFIDPQPYPSWDLDSNNEWQAPLDKPSEGNYYWSEEELMWVEIVSPE